MKTSTTNCYNNSAVPTVIFSYCLTMLKKTNSIYIYMFQVCYRRCLYPCLLLRFATIQQRITSYEDIHLYFGWPYIARVASGLLIWAVTVAAICNQCRSSTRTLQMTDDNIMTVSTEGEFYDDEAENGVLL